MEYVRGADFQARKKETHLESPRTSVYLRWRQFKSLQLILQTVRDCVSSLPIGRAHSILFSFNNFFFKSIYVFGYTWS